MFTHDVPTYFNSQMFSILSISWSYLPEVIQIGGESWDRIRKSRVSKLQS